ncbi:MAG: hypothetical protein JNK35_06520 [Phycisphaerae bacterium]|nr:hypothetical protein [Phycisphaerae bacterium]
MAIKNDDTGMDKTAKIKLGVAGGALVIAVFVLSMYFFEFGLFSAGAIKAPPPPPPPEVVQQRQQMQQEAKQQTEERKAKPGTVTAGS